VFFAGFAISSLLLDGLPEVGAVGAPEVNGHPFSRHYSRVKVPQTPYDFSCHGCNGLRVDRLPYPHYLSNGQTGIRQIAQEIFRRLRDGIP
jgi:hypothetical protein